MTLVDALGGIAGFLCLVSIVALAVSGAEFPREIRTFTGVSPAERNYDQRAKWLEWSGFTSLTLAAVVAVAAILVARG
jgi:hypothetical protein